jgi:(1->4)-alpha-D-glucan 1-alpha-D-glucosylmutase
MSAPMSAPIPTATYRLQLTPSFGFDAATELIRPLATLGVSHLYLSPIAEAVPGSTHGYDVVDHAMVRAELGGEAALTRLLDGAAAAGLGVLIDHVPNHVSVAVPHLNAPWWGMLRDGASSEHARWFDVDWDGADGKVIVPTLGAPPDAAVAAGELRLDELRHEPVLRYFDTSFPVAPGTEHGTVADVLDRQHYRLTWWRDPARNVRRFFTIDDLVAVRVEDPAVAARVDTLPARLVEHPAFAGVRIDHVDGLADPAAYLQGLRELIGDRWLLVEKILALGETLPASWPVDGTTGYEHVVHAEHVLLDPAGEAPLRALWSTTGRPGDFDAVEHTARREVLDGALAPDVDRLVRTVTAAARAAAADEIDSTTWREALAAVTLGLDRYRTYLPDDPTSEQPLRDATTRALDAHPELASSIDAFVELVRSDDAVRERWQQLTGPVMAKGAEDRAFYRCTPLAALCEVGGAPGIWTIGIEDFHLHQQRVQAGWPTTLTASTTHDTKRSGAVRARSIALAAQAAAWERDASAALEALGADTGTGMLDPADVALAFQTAVTAAPIDGDRLGDYLVKAAREAELHTSWTDPDERYEDTLRELAHELDLGAATPAAEAPRASRSAWLRPWAERLAAEGATVGIRLLALQLTVPGVPDLYQGAPAELTSLVDPDNRRPPDWTVWTRLVDASTRTGPVAAWRSRATDVARAACVQRLLALRVRHPEVFGPDGGYTPLETGSDALVGFARTGRDDIPATITIVASWRSTDGQDEEIVLPEGRWRDVLRDDVHDVEHQVTTGSLWSGATAGFGCAVLERVAR